MRSFCSFFINKFLSWSIQAIGLCVVSAFPIWNTKTPTCLLKADSLPIKNYPAGVSSISGLLYVVFPSAISGFIISVHVDTTNGGFVRRNGSHVRKELYEVESPLRTDRNSATSVVFVISSFYGMASSIHVPPNSVNLFEPSFSGQSVNPNGMPQFFGAEAPATFAFSSRKVIHPKCFNPSALAFSPYAKRPFAMQGRDGDFVECFPDVFHGHHTTPLKGHVKI